MGTLELDFLDKEHSMLRKFRLKSQREATAHPLPWLKLKRLDHPWYGGTWTLIHPWKACKSVLLI